MTADPLAYVRDALDKAERAALVAAEPEAWVELNRSPRAAWYVQHWADPDVTAVVADPDSSAYPVVVTTVGMEEADADARAAHIALHDPEAVLRRIAADREILEDCENIIGGWHHEETQEFANTIIRNLAEGWGWVGES